MPWGLRNMKVVPLGVASLVFLASIYSARVVGQTGKLNDTGIVVCADNNSNNIACGYSDGDTNGFPRQDGQMGRSAKDNAGLLTKTGAASSSMGFAFQKLDYVSGAVVGAGTAQGIAGGTWGCTKDVVTGLIWDVKVTTASNARLNTNTYNWKNSTAASNGGESGTTGTASGTTCTSSTCDTEAFISHINTLGLCGETSNDWRLPTRAELLNIIDVSKQNSGVAAVDSTYFPNMQRGRYWTSENFAGNQKSARWVDFASGSDGVSDKSSKYYVILVRP